jgi:hypothetical protein
MRKRSPVARKQKADNNYAPPLLPFESSTTAADRRAAAEHREIKPKDMLFYSKAPRGTSYKPCSINEYKMNHKPGRYVEIDSKLKPDLNSEELIAKRANAERVKEFSKNLKHYNMQNLRQQKKVPSGQEMSQIQQSKELVKSKRERMKEYTRNIPKPKVKTEKKQSDFEHGYMTAQDEFGMDYSEAVRMQELEAKHIESQNQLNAIKKSLGMG